MSLALFQLGKTKCLAFAIIDILYAAPAFPPDILRIAAVVDGDAPIPIPNFCLDRLFSRTPRVFFSFPLAALGNHNPEPGLGKPLCFVLPSAMTKELEVFHHVLSTQVVVEKDILLNVFPKHQAEITAYSYPAEVEQVLDPVVFAKRLCGCRAVIASRLHGAVIALQTGVPTIAAWPVSEGNKVPNLMNDVLGLSDQFLRVHESLSRRDLIDRVSAVRKAYSRGRRELLFDKLASISDHTREESARVLLKVAGSRQAHEEAGVDAAEGEPEERLSREEEKEKEKGAGENQAQPGIELENVVTAPASGGYEKPPTIEIELVSSTGNVHEEVSLPEVTGARANQRSEGMAPGPSNPAIDGGSDGDFSQHKGGEGSSVIRGSASAPRPQAGREIPFAGSLIVSVIALLSMALLTLPGLASLPRDGRKETAVAGSSPKGDKASLPNKVAERLLDGGLVMKASLYRRVLGDRRIRAADVLFFGVNYTVWVTLAMGFNVCSKAYMHETRNPMALLTMQGWVGVVVLGVMNLIGKFRHRRHHVCAVPDAAFTEERSSFSPSSSLPLSRFSWLARYVPAKVRHVELSVWQAGVMHSCNAVLTSWSVLVGGVAATHALKALEPVAAAGFARWLLGSRLPPGCTAGVGIIVLGLGILMMPLHLPHWAGGSEGAVQYSGMDLAIPAVVTACSCCAVALRNVFLKKPNPPPPPPLGLLVCSVVGAWVGTVALLVPFLPWSWEWSGVCLLRTSGLNAALCFMGYNLASFNLLSELSPVGHAVGNASKRVCLFATGLFLLGEEGSMSPKQLAGASIAFMGLASYSLAGTYARSRSPLPR